MSRLFFRREGGVAVICDHFGIFPRRFGRLQLGVGAAHEVCTYILDNVDELHVEVFVDAVFQVTLSHLPKALAQGLPATGIRRVFDDLIQDFANAFDKNISLLPRG